MKIAAVLLSGFLALALGASGQLANVHSVYVMPMSSGLDQHLANRLTNAGVFQVVTDPAKADAVFTDRLGESFESRLAELYPPPPAPPAAKPESDRSGEDEKKDTPPAAKADSRPKEVNPPRAPSFGGGRGTVFLVDPHSRSVLWSVYEQPSSHTPAGLDRTAARIVDRLQRSLKGK